MKKIALTGIKPTGTPHIGNLLGAIKPALKLVQEYNAIYFIADYHALTVVHDPNRLRELTYEVAATWLAWGLDPESVIFYRQSQIPEIFELNWILACFTQKGLMNRAHAYKDAVAKNTQEGKPPDFEVNMGLFTYPIMMSADILLFNADVVPVGKDQKQHVEFARDIAIRFNNNYGNVFTIPEPLIEEETMTIVGLDGRKMSKSYDNTIPIFLPSQQLKKRIFRIITTSQSKEEPKDPDKCNLFAIYKHFANSDQIESMSNRYRSGNLGWTTVKQELFKLIDAYVDEPREKYNNLMANKNKTDEILLDGTRKAREIVKPFMERIRKTVGVR